MTQRRINTSRLIKMHHGFPSHYRDPDLHVIDMKRGVPGGRATPRSRRRRQDVVTRIWTDGSFVKGHPGDSCNCLTFGSLKAGTVLTGKEDLGDECRKKSGFDLFQRRPSSSLRGQQQLKNHQRTISVQPFLRLRHRTCERRRRRRRSETIDTHIKGRGGTIMQQRRRMGRRKGGL